MTQFHKNEYYYKCKSISLICCDARRINYLWIDNIEMLEDMINFIMKCSHLLYDASRLQI